jgi:hypothetical protein
MFLLGMASNFEPPIEVSRVAGIAGVSKSAVISFLM